MIYFAYEAKIAGVFNGITFCHEGFIHPYSSVIEKNIFVYDYLPKTIGNVIDPASGMVKPKKRKRKKKDETDDGTDFDNCHWDLKSYVQATQDDYQEILEDYKEFYMNLKKYGKIVPRSMQTRPMFKFLCFILNERHRSRCISAHFGSRFDSLIVLEFLLLMGIIPKVITQGQGVLQLTVVEYDIVFIDSFKFFPQKLESLPARFQLEQFKGFFAFSWNPPKNWNRKRKNPPELSAYISDKDSDGTIAEKTRWWTEEKSRAQNF